MATYEEMLKSAWEGEVLGAAAFDAIAEACPDDAEMWACFAELERVVGGLVRSVAEPLGIAVDDATISDAARRFVSSSQPVTQSAMLDATISYLPGAIASYEQLAEVVPDDVRWLADDLLAHERALGDDLERTRADGTSHTESVRRFLAERAPASS